MTIDELKKHKKILILGYGLEGKATEEFLKAKVPGAQIGIADKSTDPDYLSRQNDYDLVIKTPGLPKRFVTVPYTTATNIFFANANAPIIGITGTKGKSTTTSLTYAMVKEAGYDARLIGNIGQPMISELLKPVAKNTLYVCELSSYQLDDIKYSPHISVILNLFPEHMDYHGSFDAYKAAKKNIVVHATPNDYFVYNPDYPELVELANKTKAQAVPMAKELPFACEIIPLLGDHNVSNVKVAYTVAKLLGIDDEKIISAVKVFKPLTHRLEVVGTFKGISFYNDAISTTPESTIHALEAVPNIDTIFLGGQDRGYEFRALAEKIIEKGVSNVVLFPDSGMKIKKEIEVKCQVLGVKCEIYFFETRDMESAVKFAYENTKKGLNCILSCASPSYSIWKNFEEKGDLFKASVRKLGV